MPEYKTDLSLSGFKKLKAEIRKYKTYCKKNVRNLHIGLRKKALLSLN